jgi:NAD(P)-dependent dehydrogenase (short-subunit alcohol dehydrogenase family)
MTTMTLFDLSGKTAVVTGGAGVLCSSMSKTLAQNGVKVAILDLFEDKAQVVADEIIADGGEAFAVGADVLDKDSLLAAEKTVMAAFGKVDILINGAGGNKAEATTTAERSFFDIPKEALQWVFNLNFLGTALASQVFGRSMVEHEQGNILNISSMTALRPLTHVMAYGGAKAAVSNFTQWLAVHMAQEYSPNIRVNALAPGFFLTEQNRFLVVDAETGGWTARGQHIVDHTPMGRFGDPEDLLGTMLWLVTDASRFVTGIVVPVDGGFSAYSGV